MIKVRIQGAVLPATEGIIPVWVLFHEVSTPAALAYGNTDISIGKSTKFTSFSISSDNLQHNQP
jgi:hypothetical protein